MPFLTFLTYQIHFQRQLALPSGLTEGGMSKSSLRFADGKKKLVHERKCMELKVFLPGSPGSKK